MPEYIVRDRIPPVLGMGDLIFYSSPNLLSSDEYSDINTLYICGIFHFDTRTSGVFILKDPNGEKIYLETKTMQMIELNKEDLLHVAENLHEHIRELSEDFLKQLQYKTLFEQHYVIGNNKSLVLKFILEHKRNGPETYLTMEYNGQDLFTNLLGMKVKIPLTSFCKYMESCFPITKICLNDLVLDKFTYSNKMNHLKTVYYKNLCGCVKPIVQNCKNIDDFNETHDITIIND